MSVVLDPVSHVYSKGLVTYTSVSAVIKAVLPTDYSAVDPAVLENARLRGVFVDEMFCAWLNGKCPVIPRGTDQDWVNRLQMLIDWWKKQGFDLIETQCTFHDDKFLIAGTADLVVRYQARPEPRGGVVDIKVVSALQPSYRLQLGAYSDMSGADVTGVIHVTRDRVRFVEYDAEECRNDWQTALSWYFTQKRLKKVSA